MSKKYITKIVPEINKINEHDISFCMHIPNKKSFKIYIENESGKEQLDLLTEYMGTKSEELFEEFLTDMNEIHINYLADNEEYMYNVMLIMFVFLDINNNGNILEGAYSYASHAYGFFTFFKKNKEIQESFEKIYMNSKKMISQIAEKYESEKNHKGLLYEKIKKTVDKLQENLKEYIQNGEIYFSDYKTDNDELNGLLYKSEFHKRNYNKVDFEDYTFLKRRCLTIFEYYFLKNTGLSYQKRSLLCYLIIRYLEEYKGFEY